MELKPQHYAVLAVLSRGAKTAEEVAAELDIEPHDAEALLSTLMAYGLVERREKGLLFKREVYALTESGWEVFAQWKRDVEQKIEKAAELRRAGREEEAEALLGPVVSVLPILLALGLIDLALWQLVMGEAEEAIGFDAGEDWAL